MPHAHSDVTSVPEWQSQQQLFNYTRQINYQAPLPSGNMETKRTSMLGSLKSKFGRRNSARSTSSRESVEETPRSSPITLTAPIELPVPESARAGASPVRERSPLLNPSPATRRPDRAGMNAFTVPSTEPPPAYTLDPTPASGPTLGATPAYTPSTRGSSPAPSARSAQQEDQYSFLRIFDTILLIDDSGSMAGRSWRETSQALSQLLPIIVERDADGIDIFFLNHLSSDPGSLKDGIPAGGYRNVKDQAEVQRIFKSVRPGGATPMGTRCRAILRPYLTRLEAEAAKGLIDEVKPLNILAITDGVPTDDVESVLISAAKKLDVLEAAPHQVGVQFFQVGNEEGAAEALRELDDDLVNMVHGGIRDMVDTCTWTGGESSDGTLKLTGQAIMKVVLGAVIKRLDRRRLSGEMRREPV